jgi:hypothetical protein
MPRSRWASNRPGQDRRPTRIRNQKRNQPKHIKTEETIGERENKDPLQKTYKSFKYSQTGKEPNGQEDIIGSQFALIVTTPKEALHRAFDSSIDTNHL